MSFVIGRGFAEVQIRKRKTGVIGLRSEQFTFGYGVVIGFTMQSPFERISKNPPIFPSQRGNPPTAILFILKAATAITSHTKSYEIAAMTTHSFVKFNFSSPSVSLRNAP